MTLETLEIRFQADVQAAIAQLHTLTESIRQVDTAASGMYSAGLRLSKGLASGIYAGKGSVIRAANEVAQAAVSRIRNALQIHSPSRVTQGLGEQFSQGFALGVMDAAAQAAMSANALAGTARDALHDAPLPEGRDAGISDSVYRALSGLTVVAPIQVDGVKLGEAAIRGINAVKRTTGRQMLDI